MATKPVLNVALIGYAFMGRAHSNAYRQVGHFFPDSPYTLQRKVLVGRTEAAVKKAAVELGWDETSTDAEAVIKRPDIDIIDIGTPNDSHYDLAMKAIKAGKIVMCEKPLAMTTKEARTMAAAAKKAGVPNLIWHNYRRAPAATTAAQLIADGKLGEIRHVRAVYLQDWLIDDACPYTWRMNEKTCGSGAHGDLNAHLIDMTRFMTGLEFTEVCGMSETFIKTRRHADGKGKGTVDVDDAFLFLAKLSNGAVASYEATRAALGRKNYNRIEINGTTGSLVWNFERMNELEFFDGSDDPRVQGFRTIMCMNGGAHAYAGNYWPDGHIIGYEHTFINTLADFLVALKRKQEFRPNFADGVASEEVLEAAILSVKKHKWVTVGRSQSATGHVLAGTTTRATRKNAAL
jgi:predicted dehydrogenase